MVNPRILAGLLLSLSCSLASACLQRSEPQDAITPAPDSTDEPTGQAEEPAIP